MSGAIAMAGMATLRSGAGLVTLAIPDPCLEVVASFEPSYMTVPLPCDSQGRLIAACWEPLAARIDSATCVACGPGLGQSPEIIDLVAHLYQAVKCPLVLDADGLNALASIAYAELRPAGPRVITPHPGEFRRLIGAQHGDHASDALQELAVDLAAQTGMVVVLKGHRTLVTDGQRVSFNNSGNPGMATGGSGDVLTGIVTGLISQGLTPIDAAQLAVYLHGRAGDLAACELGQVSMIASDLLRFLPAAFREIQTQE